MDEVMNPTPTERVCIQLQVTGRERLHAILPLHLRH